MCYCACLNLKTVDATAFYLKTAIRHTASQLNLKHPTSTAFPVQLSCSSAGCAADALTGAAAQWPRQAALGGRCRDAVTARLSCIEPARTNRGRGRHTGDRSSCSAGQHPDGSSGHARTHAHTNTHTRTTSTRHRVAYKTPAPGPARLRSRFDLDLKSKIEVDLSRSSI